MSQLNWWSQRYEQFDTTDTVTKVTNWHPTRFVMITFPRFWVTYQCIVILFGSKMFHDASLPILAHTNLQSNQLPCSGIPNRKPAIIPMSFAGLFNSWSLWSTKTPCIRRKKSTDVKLQKHWGPCRWLIYPSTRNKNDLTFHWVLVVLNRDHLLMADKIITT